MGEAALPKSTHRFLLLLKFGGLFDGLVDGHALLNHLHDLQLALVAEGGELGRHFGWLYRLKIQRVLRHGLFMGEL